MLAMPKRGLYVITHTEGRTINDVVKHITDVVRGGATMVQYRDKNPIDALVLAQELVAVCHAYSVPLIINDDVELAARVGADGVHLGEDDGEITLARQRLGQQAIIGVSCYNSLERAISSEKQGATYVAFGRFFSSNSKPLAAPADIGTLVAAKKILSLPIVAIGGILPENGASLIDAGADLLAVIGGLVAQKPTVQAQKYGALFS